MDSMDSEDYPLLQAPSPFLLGMASLRLPESEEYPFDSRREPLFEPTTSPSGFQPDPDVDIRPVNHHSIRHSSRLNVHHDSSTSSGHRAASATLMDIIGKTVKEVFQVASASLGDTHNGSVSLDAHGGPGAGTGILDHSYNRTAEIQMGEVDDAILYRYSLPAALLYCAAYLVVFAVGLVGNCFVIAVVFRTPRMRTVTNYFIVNLAVADILVIVFCLPATLMSSIFVPWVLGWWMCKCVSYVQGVSVVASVYSLIAVSLDRFLAIWYPLKCQITTRRARVMILGIWVIALTTTIPWALFFDTVMTPLVDDQEVLMCREVWPENMSGEMYFLVANLLCCYVVPLVLISLCYVLIWIKVWRRSIPSDSKDAQMERMQQKSKIKVVKMLVVVVILFVLSWLPLYIIFARIKLGGDTTPWEDDAVAVATPIAQWLGSSNSCINPILYAFFNNKYRRGFQAILQSRRCCGRLRYYETVAMVGSSSASMRKSSYYVTNGSTRRAPTPVVLPVPVGPAPGHESAVSYICNTSAYIAASNTGV